MDERTSLQEAKATLANIKTVQANLDEYVVRLDKIIYDLEIELYGEKQLTKHDINVINNVEDEVEEEPVVVKVKTRKRLSIFFFVLAALSLLVSIFTYYISANEFINFNNKTYFTYTQKNLEPYIKENSLLTVKSADDLNLDEYVLYYSSHDIVRIKQFKKLEESTYHLTNPGQIISSYEEVDQSKVIGVVDEVNSKLGAYLVLLINIKYLLYILTVALFIIGILVI